jgi:hypothetical protein
MVDPADTRRGARKAPSPAVCTGRFHGVRTSLGAQMSESDIITPVVPANEEMTNVPAAFAGISASGTRQYYQCATAPTSAAGLIFSHFKGIARFGGKLIFTHTNLTPVPSPNGAYLIADRIVSGDQGTVEATYPTMHPGWPHPCACQGCGSFMAMGIQAAASGAGSQVSEIQILDLRMTQVNQPAQLIATIPRPTTGSTVWE